MNCVYCQAALPDSAKFCPECGNQNRCKACNAEVLKDALVCLECGESLKTKTVQAPVMNTFEFTESKNGRSIKSSFTNEVGGSIAQTLGVVIANKMISIKPNVTALPAGDEHKEPEQETKDVEAKVIDPPPPPLPKGSPLEILSSKIFKDDGGKVSLLETRLKIETKAKWSQRLTYLFLYYKKLKGVSEVPREDLNSILSEASVLDANYRIWLRSNPNVGVSGANVVLKNGGEEAAKTAIEEILNPELTAGWKVGTVQAGGRKKKKEKEKDKK